jgi:hypothetical protein
MAHGQVLRESHIAPGPRRTCVASLESTAPELQHHDWEHLGGLIELVHVRVVRSPKLVGCPFAVDGHPACLAHAAILQYPFLLRRVAPRAGKEVHVVPTTRVG